MIFEEYEPYWLATKRLGCKCRFAFRKQLCIVRKAMLLFLSVFLYAENILWVIISYNFNINSRLLGSKVNYVKWVFFGKFLNCRCSIRCRSLKTNHILLFRKDNKSLSEYRNPKQIQMTKIQNVLNIWILILFRISNFLLRAFRSQISLRGSPLRCVSRLASRSLEMTRIIALFIHNWYNTAKSSILLRPKGLGSRKVGSLAKTQHLSA